MESNQGQVALAVCQSKRKASQEGSRPSVELDKYLNFKILMFFHCHLRVEVYTAREGL